MTKESKKFIIGITLAAIIGFGSGYVKGYSIGYNHQDHLDHINEVLTDAGKYMKPLQKD